VTKNQFASIQSIHLF